MLPAFVPLPVIADATVRALQDAVQRALKRVCQCPLLDGLLISGLVLPAATPTTLQHRLGRTPLGYLVVSLSAPAIISVSGTPQPSSFTLTASAATTASLWVF